MTAVMRPATNELGVSELEKITHLLENRDTYTVTDGYTPPAPTVGGHPLEYPPYFGFVFGCLRDIFGSARKAATALHGPLLWDFVRELVEQNDPNEDTKRLPDKPPHRTWYIKWRNRHVSQGLEPLREALTNDGVAVASELGLLIPKDPEQKRTPTRAG